MFLSYPLPSSRLGSSSLSVSMFLSYPLPSSRLGSSSLSASTFLGYLVGTLLLLHSLFFDSLVILPLPSFGVHRKVAQFVLLLLICPSSLFVPPNLYSLDTGEMNEELPH
jgi:hypothetical protein